MTWNTLLKEIRDTNRVLLHRQEGGKYIPVRDESSHFTADEDITILESGYIHFDWKCEHATTEDYYGFRACDDCGAVFNDLERIWENEK